MGFFFEEIFHFTKSTEGDRCRGDDCRRNDYDDFANRGAGKDDVPLDDGRRKRIRRMGMQDNTFFFAKSFLIGILRKVYSRTHSSIFFEYRRDLRTTH